MEQPIVWSASGKPCRVGGPTRVLGTDPDLKPRTPLRPATKMRRIERPDTCTKDLAARWVSKNDLQTGEQPHMLEQMR